MVGSIFEAYPWMITFGSHLAGIKTERCGVVPFAIDKYTLHFLLARHKNTKELGDLGGGVKRREFSLGAGFREFCEESRGIFMETYGSPNDLEDKLAIIDGKSMAVIFAPLSIEWLGVANKKFIEKRPTRKCEDEISELVWVDEKRFQDLVYSWGEDSEDTLRLWKKVQTFFQKTYRSKVIPDLLRMITFV